MIIFRLTGRRGTAAAYGSGASSETKPITPTFRSFSSATSNGRVFFARRAGRGDRRGCAGAGLLFEDFLDVAHFVLDFARGFLGGAASFEIAISRGLACGFLHLADSLVLLPFHFVFGTFVHTQDTRPRRLEVVEKGRKN